MSNWYFMYAEWRANMKRIFVPAGCDPIIIKVSE
jgi:hypothetical protein